MGHREREATQNNSLCGHGHSTTQTVIFVVHLSLIGSILYFQYYILIRLMSCSKLPHFLRCARANSYFYGVPRLITYFLSVL